MKISVIVPVYNSAEYLHRCVESIIGQTYRDWELILVDDGSKDNSWELICGYAEKDNRIIPVHQENGGPGSARNTGMGYATGEYTVFVDSDDVIGKKYLDRLSKETADVVFIDVALVDDSRKILRREYMSGYRDYSKNDFIRMQMTGSIPWGGVRKAAKTKLLKDNEIRFTEHRIGEEAIYSFLVMFYAKSFSFLKGALYLYFDREGSQSNTKDEDPWGGVSLALKRQTVQMGIYKKYADTINAFLVTAAIVSLDRLAGSCSLFEYLKKGKERVRRYRREIDGCYPVDFKHMSKKAGMMYPFLRFNIILPVFVASRIKKLFRKGRV